ncbi:MAG TPA: tetratricopeptide repeat protein, partial [Isosphaeraceae bacterium]|nr:tetratricopeptide repeat protein [Isosphaeraceae bacterium]
SRLFLGNYKEARKHFEEFLKVAPDHHNAPTAVYRVGETAYMLGDLPAVRKALETYTSNYPNHRYLETAWTYLGDVCFQLKDYAKARLAYQQALSSFPEGRLADRSRYGLGRTLAAQGEAEEALRIFADLVDRDVKDWAERARLETAQVQVNYGKHADAVRTFEQLEQAAPKSPLIPEARLRRAQSLARIGRHEEAEALLRSLMADASPGLAVPAAEALGALLLERGRPAEARAVLDEALKRFQGSPMTPALLFRSAEAAQKEGRADLARARYLKVVELAPEDTWADDSLVRAAALALEAREFAAARSQANALATRYPSSTLVPEAHLIEARAVLGQGQARVAITLLNHLLSEEKPSAETAQTARYYLGQAYRADGQVDKASEILESLAKTPAAPVATDAQFLVGEGHFHAGRFKEAIAPLEKYLAGKPRGEVADHALAYLAAARQELGQLDAAVATLDRLAAQFPKSKTLPPTRLRLAEAALAAKQLDRAAKWFQQGAETDDPKLKVRALSGLGWTLLQDGKPAEAAAAFETRLAAAADDPLAPQDSLARGRALEEANQVEEALAAYAAVATRFPKSDQAGPASLARARLLAKANRPEEAARVFASYFEEHPNGHAESGSDGLDAVLAEWGWALLDANKTADADRVFTRLLNECPESARANDARLNLAESAYQAKKFDEVVRLLDPLVAEGSKADAVLVQTALYRLGRTFVQRKDWPGATRLFDRLVSAYPAGSFHREARFWKAEVAFQSGDAKTAEAEFAALATEPPAVGEDPATERWIQTAQLRRVQSSILLERWKDALAQADVLKASAPLHPQMAEIDYARGRALQGLAQFEEARAAYQAVIDARKSGDLAARAQLMRGETYFHQKNYDEALHELLKVDVLYDAPVWQAAALLEAGKVYERLAQWADAAEMYKRILSPRRKLREKFPNDPNAAEAARRLEEVQKQATAPTARASADESH